MPGGQSAFGFLLLNNLLWFGYKSFRTAPPRDPTSAKCERGGGERSPHENAWHNAIGNASTEPEQLDVAPFRSLRRYPNTYLRAEPTSQVSHE